MSQEPIDRLVYMANQISQFFISQPGESQALRVAEHIKAFWTPPMRKDIIAHMEAGGAGFSPLTAEAIRTLKEAPGPHTLERELHAAGQPAPGHDPGDDAG